jgi:hypothetical protein
MRGFAASGAQATELGGAAVGGLMAFLLGLLAWAVMALIIYATVIPLTNGALTIAVADRILGGGADWRAVWSTLFRSLPRLLSALIPAALLCAVGFFFLVIPGLLLCFFFALVPTVVLVEGKSGVDALKRSFALVKSDWLRVALVFICFGVLSAVAHWVGGLFVPSRAIFVSHLLGDLLTLVLMPVPIIGAVLLYLDLRRREGVGTEALRAELDAVRAG